jgi:hypothetical protein
MMNRETKIPTKPKNIDPHAQTVRFSAILGRTMRRWLRTTLE